MRTLESYYTPKLKSSEQAWLTAGYNPPTEARSILGMLSSRHELIHGDPSGRNMLMNSSQLTLLDPIGVEGAAEFDAGRWIARCAAMSAPCELGELIAMAEKADPSLDRGRLLWCVGLALMSEVRYRILMPTYYQNLGASPVGFDAYTRHLSNVTSDLLN
jgi:hypothetical protein